MKGANLFTSQVVRLPVRDFFEAQKIDSVAHETGFKNQPPGYQWLYNNNDNKKE